MASEWHQKNLCSTLEDVWFGVQSLSVILCDEVFHIFWTIRMTTRIKMTYRLSFMRGKSYRPTTVWSQNWFWPVKQIRGFRSSLLLLCFHFVKFLWITVNIKMNCKICTHKTPPCLEVSVLPKKLYNERFKVSLLFTCSVLHFYVFLMLCTAMAPNKRAKLY